MGIEKALNKIYKKTIKESFKIPVLGAMCLASTAYTIVKILNTSIDKDPGIPYYEWNNPPRIDPFKPEKDLKNIIKACYKYIINDSSWNKNFNKAYSHRQLSDDLHDNSII